MLGLPQVVYSEQAAESEQTQLLSDVRNARGMEGCGKGAASENATLQGNRAE